MGFYIRDLSKKLKVPRDCNECGSLGYCGIVGLTCPANEGLYSSDSIPFGCPIIEIRTAYRSEPSALLKKVVVEKPKNMIWKIRRKLGNMLLGRG